MMKRKSAAVSEDALKGREVECTFCHVRMSGYLGPGNTIRYFRCGSCHRWVSSAYMEIFSADANFRTFPAETDGSVALDFERVKSRLERWLAALDDQDPYRLLGVSPMDSSEKIRARYRELALQCHPDRGGSAEKMQELNLAYERITDHRERRRKEALGPGVGAIQAVFASEGGF